MPLTRFLRLVLILCCFVPLLYASRVPSQAGHAATAYTPFIIENAQNDQDYPSIAFSPVSQRYIVTWLDLRNSYAGILSVYVRVLLVDGTPVASSFSVSDQSSISPPAISYLPSQDRFLLVWSAISGTNLVIMGQRFSGNGTRLGNPFVIASSSTLSPWYPAVAAGSDGWLVVWDAFVNSNTSHIEGRKVLPDGGLVGTGSIRLASNVGTLPDPQVAYATDAATYLVVWDDSRSGLGDDIYGQRVASDTTLVGANVGIGVTTNAQVDPAIDYDPQRHAFLVAWKDTRRNGSALDIYARWMTSAGEAQGSDLLISTTNQNDQQFMGIALTYHPVVQEHLILWSDQAQGGGIRALRLDSSGTVRGSPFRLAPGNYSQVKPAAAFDEVNGRFLAVWQEMHASWDIYGLLYAPPIPALRLTKAAPSQVIAGQPLTYTLFITNTGEVQANHLVLTDTLPAGLTFIWSDPAPDQVSEPDVWSLGSLSPQASKIISLTVSVPLGMGKEGTPNLLTNRAVATADLAQPVSATVQTTLLTPDLSSATITVDRSRVMPGEVLSYAILITNTGNLLSQAWLTDTLPAGLGFAGNLSASAGSIVWDVNQGQLFWKGTIPAGDTVTLRFDALVDHQLRSGVMLYNTALLNDGLHPPFELPLATTLIVAPDLTRSGKYVDHAQAYPGDVLSYTIILTNTGLAAAQANLTDTLPAEIEFQQISPGSPGNAVWDGENSILYWQSGIPVNTSVALTYTARLRYGIPPDTVIRNQAWVTDGVHARQTLSTVETRVRWHRIFLPVIHR
ncbi:MAG: DUF11 domain-containing protein [Chloroflexi bacterium]|nr:DUF11 domain-containing protein [Chloroflexota bacterium]